MNSTDLQTWLNAHGASLAVDGKCGPATRSAIVAAFTNPRAPAVTDSEIAAFALRLGCTVKQLRAVAFVESGGSAFDGRCRPKMLFERHYFHRLTEGKYSVAPWSNPAGGGYGEDAWDKLARAACVDAHAAFQSASWGKFQVMGAHWKTLGYAAPIDLAYSTVVSEAGSYELLARFIDKNGLSAKLRALSPVASACAPFAAAYNGPGYRKFNYDQKLAARMAA